jgi:DNA polymerase-1
MFDIPLHQLHYDNALLCRPQKKHSPLEYRKAIDCCKPRLEKSLKRSGARTVLALGGRAQYAMLSKSDPIRDWCGAPMPSALSNGRYTTIVTYQPAYCMRANQAFFKVFQIHTQRAWLHATDRLPKWHWPKLYVDNDIYTLNALCQLKKAKRLGIDIETAGTDPVTCDITAVGIAGRVGKKRIAVSVNWPPEDNFATKKIGDECRRLVGALLKSSIPKAAHNGVHDILGFEREGFTVNAYDYDTILQHVVVAPKLLHRLGFACCLEFPMPRWKKEFRVGADEKGLERFLTAPKIELATYNAKDAWMTLILSYALEERLHDEHNGQKLYAEYLEQSLISMHMREVGILINEDNVERHRKIFHSRRQLAQRDLRKLAVAYKFKGGKTLNPRSNDQIKDFFFGKLRVTPIKYSQETGKPSLDKLVLDKLCIHPNPKVQVAAQLLIRYRRWDKLLSFVDKELPLDEEGAIHADGRCWGTKGGRWAYRDPNLTTIPKPKFRKSTDGKKNILVAPGLRDIIMARPGCVLVEADYSQLELRIVALLSGDPLLLEWYSQGADVHYENAKRWLGTDMPSKSQRDFAKKMVYEMNYGAGAETIWQKLVVDHPGIYLSDVQRYLEMWYTQHSAIRSWQKKMLRIARDEDYVECPISGRRQHFHGAVEPTKVYNYPIQGTAADIINGAIKRIYPQIQWKRGENLLLQVHDALIGETPKRHVARMAKLFKKEMERPVVLDGAKVGFPIDWKIGPTWGEAVECKTLKEVRKAA